MVLKLKKDAVGLFGLATVQLLKRRQEEVEQSKSQQARQQAWRAGGAAVHQVDRMCVFMCVCMCVRAGRAAGGRWTLVQLAGGSGPLAGGCSENRNLKKEGLRG